MKRKYAAMMGLALSMLLLEGCAEIESFLGSQEEQTADSRYDEVSDIFDEAGNVPESSIAMAEPEDMEWEQGIEYYPAVTEYAVDMETDGETYTSGGAGENAVHVFGEAQVILRNAEITRTARSSSDGEDLSAYGVGAAMLATSGTAYLKNSSVTTSAGGGAGIFAYGDGTVYAFNTTVNTKKDISNGIETAGGGTFYAWNLKADTGGKSSAAVKNGRRGSAMVLDGGTYTTNGVNSPAVYNTGDIAIRSGTLTANQWEAICMEGNQSLFLYDCDVTGNKADDISNDCTWNVILYQSESGMSSEGQSTFEMNGGTLTAKNGGMFYTTNVKSTVTLSNVKIEYPMVNEFFLKCTGNNNQRGWGKRGANGADCIFTAHSQNMVGDVIWDSISRIDFYMSGGSTLKGAVRKDENYAGAGGEGYCNLYVDTDCAWIVAGNSTLSRLSCQGTIVDDDGNAVTVQGKDGTIYMQGAGKYTVTVDVYESLANMSGASAATEWMEHQMEIPQEME